MRTVLSSEDLQTKHEFQDLGYRLLKAREDIVTFFEGMPDVQKDLSRNLEAASAELSRVHSLDNSNVETMKLACGIMEKIVGKIESSLDYYSEEEKGIMPKYVRYLNKIIAKVRSREQMIYKRGLAA